MPRLSPILSRSSVCCAAALLTFLAVAAFDASRVAASCGDYLLHGDAIHGASGSLENRLKLGDPSPVEPAGSKGPRPTPCDGLHCAPRAFTPPPVQVVETELRVQSIDKLSSVFSTGNSSREFSEFESFRPSPAIAKGVFRPPR
jgi:hypothetical protein